MRRFLFGVTVFALAFVPLAGSGQDKKGEQDKKGDRDEILAEMMQKKLKSAHLVLDGVAIGDFKKIANGGEELIRLAKSETWQLIRSPHYERHSADFVRTTENLVKKAKEKNMDGAALAYVEMTLSCVRCHQYVREHRRDARLNLDSLKSLAAAPVSGADISVGAGTDGSLTALPSTSSSGDQQPDKEVKKKANLWMKAKTKLSQEILVGLTEGDFEKIGKNAKALNLVDYFEVISRSKSDEYRQHSNLFGAANVELIRQAEAKNIYGATLAYNQLTVSCVQCHVVVRRASK
jgi:cytochrome c556